MHTFIVCVFSHFKVIFFGFQFKSSTSMPRYAPCIAYTTVSLIPQYRLYHSIAYIKEYMSVSLIPRFIYYHVFLFSWYVTVHTINT